MFKNSLKTIPHASHGQGSSGTESDRPASAFIAQMSLVLVVALAVIWFVFEGLMWTAATRVEGEYLAESDAMHAQMRVTEEEVLHQFSEINAEKGVYQIPIDQAIDTLVKQGTLEIK